MKFSEIWLATCIASRQERRYLLCKQISQSQKLSLHHPMLLQNNCDQLVYAQVRSLFLMISIHLCPTIYLTLLRDDEAIN